jgi:predicted transcriptional regulator of viral defense system
MDAIRTDEWMQEIERLSQRHIEGFTMQEVADAIGISSRQTREKVGKAIRLGILAHVGFRDGKSIDGKRCRIPVYRRVGKKR